MSRSDRGGFTFLELLVALAILGASFTVLLTANASALRQQAAARRLMTATLLAREILARTEVDGLPSLGSDRGEFGEGFPGYAWQRQVEATEIERLRQVRIRVEWPEGRRTRATEITYFTAEEEEP